MAAQSLRLTPYYYDPLRNTETPDGGIDYSYTIRDTGFYTTPYPNGNITTQARLGTGTVINDGLITTQQGTTILSGDNVLMSGVISADTGIARNSSVFLDAATQAVLSGTITIQPYDDGQPLPTASASQFVPAFVEMSGYRTTLELSALISAPGASVAINGLQPTGARNPNLSLLGTDTQARTDLLSGATIDVSGLQNVQLPADYNIISFQPRGAEFANMPLQRGGPLFGQTLYIDIRDSGTRSDGTAWVGTPLADARGFVGLVPLSIYQLLTPAGSVKFNQALANNSSVNAQAGSVINVAGGSVQYLPGYAPATTQLLGTDGRIYNISAADPNMTYVGIYSGGFTVDHGHWNQSETYIGPSQNGTAYLAGYTDGANAGSISVQAVNPALAGTMIFGSVAGDRQRSLGTLPSQGSFSLVTTQGVIMGDPSAVIASSMNYTSLAASTLALSATQYSDYGLSNLSITSNDFYLPAGASVALAPGGSFSVAAAGSIDIQGIVQAKGGSINLTAEPYDLGKTYGSVFKGSLTSSGLSLADIFVEGTLDVSGQWVNDTLVPPGGQTGPAYINGGTINITTNTYNTSRGGASASILLSNTSLLGVSSGGYIDQKGVLKSSGPIPVGNGGNIALQTFQGSGFDPQGSAGPREPTAAADIDVGIFLNGTLSGYGFTEGGTLTIKTPRFQIGGQAPSDPNTLYLSPSFFTIGGFSSYVLKSPNNAVAAAGLVAITNSFTLAANTTLTLSQQNFSPLGNYTSLVTGTRLSTVAPLTTLPLDERKPVNLTISSGNVLFDTGSAIVTDPGASISVATNSLQPTAYGLLMLGAITDHGGSLSVQSPYIWLGSGADFDFSGIYIANSKFGYSAGSSESGYLLPGGSVTFDNTIVGGSGAVSGFVVGESGANINVSGVSADIVSRIGPANAPYLGTFTDVPSWSDGGTIAFNTGSLLWAGSFEAAAGAPQGNNGTFMLGGNAVAVQATNSITANGGVGFDVVQQIQSLVSKSTSPQALAAIGSLTATIPDIAAVDHLSGFDTVYLYSGAYGTTKGAGFFAALPPYPVGANPTIGTISRLPLTIYGNVDLHVANRLYLEGSAIKVASPSAQVSLSAPYVMLAGQQQSSAAPTAGTGSIAISGDTIDVQTAVFQGVSQVSFTATNDIRLMTPPVDDGTSQSGNQTTFFGGITAAGDLSFRAQRIYPVSDVQFEILSTSATGTIRFDAQPGVDPSDIPLSVGGSLTVAAPSIIQNGNIFAPLGTIALGALSLSDLNSIDVFRGSVSQTTASVTIGAGSITSVSLAGQSLPFGQTQDGTNWFYNSDTAPLGSLPGKTVRLNGATVTVTSGATIDESGGGDVFAFEFVQGKGGTTDVLSNLNWSTSQSTYKSPAIYAILPSGAQPPVGAFDINFDSYLGDPSPAAGQQVYLNGAAGLAAGWYTLYPAHYATLPGAYEIVDYGNALNQTKLPPTVATDGTMYVTGHIGQTNIGKSASGSELFAVQSNAVWRQYTDDQAQTGNAYFAANTGGPLPSGGGRLSIAATTALTLNTVAQAAAAPGGVGSELDIAAPAIDIIETGTQAQTGYLGIDVNQLDSSGFGSILIGGRRTDQTDGTTLITPTANYVRVDLSSTPLVADEIILAAAPQYALSNIPAGGGALPPGFTLPIVAGVEGTGVVTVASGSVITSTGLAGSSGAQYVLGGTASWSTLATALGGTYDPTTQTINGVAYAGQPTLNTLGAYGTLSGAGSLLLVSSDPSVSVMRRNATPVTVNLTYPATLVLPAPGSVVIEDGARIGNGAVATNAQPQSVILSATGANNGVSIKPGAQIGAQSLMVQASTINVGDAIPANVSSGFVVNQSILAQISAVNSLNLEALAGNIDFYSFNAGAIAINAAKTIQNITLDAPSLVGNGQDVTISAAKSITLVNTQGGTQSTGASVGGQFNLDAGTGAGDGNIVLGGGTMTLAGFANSTWSADQRIVVGGQTNFALGSASDTAHPVAFTMNTPNLLVGGASAGSNGFQSTLTTLGDFVLRGNGTAPAATDQFGGNLQISAASILVDSATIEAPSGVLALHATGPAGDGDVNLGRNSRIDAPGYVQTFFDVIKYGPGGHVTLTSEFRQREFRSDQRHQPIAAHRRRRLRRHTRGCRDQRQRKPWRLNQRAGRARSWRNFQPQYQRRLHGRRARSAGRRACGWRVQH